MRLRDAAHTSQQWRIQELTSDFRLEDVWELPTPGGPDDFPTLVRLIASKDPDERGRFRGQMAIYVKPNGILGTSYMAAIRPFRHWIVYPAMMRRIQRRWESVAS